jgi:hypothetical protein
MDLDSRGVPSRTMAMKLDSQVFLYSRIGVLDVVFKLLPERGSENLDFFLTARVSGNVSRFARVLNVFVSVI